MFVVNDGGDDQNILCLSLRTTMISAGIPEEDAYYCARNICVFSRVQKRNPGLTRKGCVLQRMCISFGALSDIRVILGMRQSIGCGVRCLVIMSLDGGEVNCWAICSNKTTIRNKE